MARFWAGAVAAVLCVGFAPDGAADAADTVKTFSQLEQTWGAEISPDGSKVAFGCVIENRRSICVSGLDEPTSTLLPAPKEADVKDFYWASDKHVIMTADFVETERLNSGAREIRFVRGVSYDVESGEASFLMKNFMRNTANTGIVDSLLVNDDDHVMMSIIFGPLERQTRTRIQDTGVEYVPLKVSLQSGQARRQSGFGGSVRDVLYDAEGDEIAHVVFDDEKDYFEIRAPGNKLVYEKRPAALRPFSLLAEGEDGQSVIIYGDGSDPEVGRGLRRLSLADGAITRIFINGRDMAGTTVITDRHTGQVVGYNYQTLEEGRQQLFVDAELQNRRSQVAQALGSQVVRLTSWSRDRSRFIAAANPPGQPPTYYLFEADKMALGLVGATYPALEGATLGTVIPISYAARDGLEINGYLTLPPGATREDGPFPFLLMPHGGPSAHDTMSYDWWAQAYAAEGYAVLQPNYRGSTDRGQEFRAAGFGEFGGKMITDIIDGAAWAEREGVAASGGVCIAGASYGGYAALMAPLYDADRVKCAVSVNGVTAPINLMGQGGVDSELVAYWEQYMGDLFSGESAQATITPLARVSEYRTPVLLIHGDEDTVVPYNQADQFRAAAKDRSWFSFVRMKGEDHWLMTQSARETMLKESIEFLNARHPARASLN